MLPRILLEIVVIAIPFGAFGLYRLLLQDAEIEGRKAWPIKLLFGIGVVMAAIVWLFLIFREDRGEACNRPAYTDPETGQLVPAQSYDCDINLEDLGVPRREDSAQ